MHYSSSVKGAAVLLAIAPSVLALGTATVYNNCGFPIYYADISTSPADMSMLPAGGAYSTGYSSAGTGYSIKVSPNNDLQGPISQFEFTWNNGQIAYDISNINGDPFESEGMILNPSVAADASYPTCVVVDCPAGDGVCTAAYNDPNDVATKACGDYASLVLTVCSGGAKLKRDVEEQPSLVAAILHDHNRVHARHLPKK